jgi:hypothetical protein
MDISMPASPLQSRGGYEGIAAVISFAGKDKAVSGTRKELLNCLCDPSPRLIHQGLGGDAMCKRGIFCITHLRRGNDRRVHCSSELTFFFSVLEDFFVVEVLWRRCFVPDSRMKR